MSGAAVPSVCRNRPGCAMKTLICEEIEPATNVPKNTVRICRNPFPVRGAFLLRSHGVR